MGDKVKKGGKGLLEVATLGISESDTAKGLTRDFLGQTSAQDLSGRTAQKAAQKAQKKQSNLLRIQTEKEQLRLDEASSDVERRKRSPRNVGRQSLINSSLSATTGG